MDADVYGPSIPHLLGVSQSPTVVNNRIQPIQVDGMPVMSMGFLVPPGEAVVWRGPMLHGAITQFLRDTRLGGARLPVIDMPPGTGDIALTLSQLLPLTGAVVVCTPQDVALLDAVKAIAMFRKVNIHVLGMVENMSGFICPGLRQALRHLRQRRSATAGRVAGRALPRRSADRDEVPRTGRCGTRGRQLPRSPPGRAAGCASAGDSCRTSPSLRPNARRPCRCRFWTEATASSWRVLRRDAISRCDGLPNPSEDRADDGRHGTA